MYQLYSILKDCDELPMPDEITIASAQWQLDETTEAEYLQKCNAPRGGVWPDVGNDVDY